MRPVSVKLDDKFGLILRIDTAGRRKCSRHRVSIPGIPGSLRGTRAKCRRSIAASTRSRLAVRVIFH
jgi:hypothetical protein